MNIISVMFGFAFDILNLPLTIPLNIDGTNKITFPLYVVFIAIFIIQIIHVVWAGVMYSSTDVE